MQNAAVSEVFDFARRVDPNLDLEGLDRVAGARVLARNAIEGFTVNRETVGAALERNPILVTALNKIIGYEKGAMIAKKAYAEKRPIIEVAVEESGLPEDELRRLLDPKALTRSG